MRVSPDRRTTTEAARDVGWASARSSRRGSIYGIGRSGSRDHEVERLPGADRSEVVVFSSAPPRPPGVIAATTNSQSALASLSRRLHQNGQVDEIPQLGPRCIDPL